MLSIIILASVISLAWWNGANDNFKGVATLYGSGSASYRVALTWATVTQIVGSLLATVLAAGLIQTFSAKGLVPDAVASDPAFLGAVAIGGMATVLLATVVGMPISTTHALTGALVGAGTLAVGTRINLGVLGSSFFLPLLVSPVISMILTMALYPLAHVLRKALGVKRASHTAAAGDAGPVPPLSRTVAVPRWSPPVTAPATHLDRYEGRVLGVPAHGAVDAMHFVSAGAICFARALNDTPKILALCLSAKALGAPVGLPLLGAAMAVGGLLNARKVAETISKKITPVNTGHGLVANATTAFLVIVASRFGVPVSTTHVATSAVFGIGILNRAANRKTIINILTAWVTTLPCGAIMGGLAYLIMAR